MKIQIQKPKTLIEQQRLNEVFFIRCFTQWTSNKSKIHQTQSCNLLFFREENENLLKKEKNDYKNKWTRDPSETKKANNIPRETRKQAQEAYKAKHNHTLKYHFIQCEFAIQQFK